MPITTLAMTGRVEDVPVPPGLLMTWLPNWKAAITKRSIAADRKPLLVVVATGGRFEVAGSTVGPEESVTGMFVLGSYSVALRDLIGSSIVSDVSAPHCRQNLSCSSM